jgi:iron complex transport system substrate-binding protein
MKLNVLEVNHGNLESLFASIEAIGGRSGVSERAVRLIMQMRSRLEDIRLRTAKTPRRSLIFIVGRTPGKLDGLVAVGKGSYLNELVDIAGGVNTLAGTSFPIRGSRSKHFLE